jgi:hypothetical protein
MLTCDQCRSALLDRQYDLLDAAESAALDAHLATCQKCQAEQRAVERFGRLVSAAARTEFPDVRFVAPANRLAATRVREPRAPLRRLRLAASLAAGALAAGLVLAIGMHLTTVSRQRTELATAQAKFTALDRKRRDAIAQRQSEVAAASVAVTKAHDELQTAQSQMVTKLAEAEQQLLAKKLNFIITGPATIQAGAPAQFVIETRDNAQKPTPATVTYRVKDQSNAVVFENKPLASGGAVTIQLPADLELKPNRELFLEVAAARPDGEKAELREQLKLASPVYATHLTTDKPLYQPGEVVHFRSLTLDRSSLKPADGSLAIQFVVRDPLGAETPIVTGMSQLATADGKPIAGPDGKPVQGVGAGEWTIPAEARGGEYTLAVKETHNRFPEERRKFLINQYQPALLNKELEWSRKSFGPGDEVVANCKVTNASGPVANQPVTAQAFVDGQPVAVPAFGPTSADGTVAVRFKLPQQIDRGEGSLTVVFTDGGSRESLSKPIPIALKKLAVEFFVEGGDLVAGAANRVYFQARTTLGKPADLKGRIVDGTARVVATAETLSDALEPGINQGMGRFEFTPEVGQTYRLAIDQPVGTEGEYRLPPVRAEGVVLTSLADVSGDPDPIRVRVTSPSVGRTLLVGAYARGRLLDHRRVTIAANKSADVELRPEAGIGGVTRVTVFEELAGDGARKQLQPRAERLVYRKPAAGLTLTTTPDKKRYVPGDRVTMSIKAGEPAIAVVGVVNKSVVTMADEKTFRTMPTHFLLTSEVNRPEDLEHADVLLGSHPKAAAALDLLLGTQGWRRFAEQNDPKLQPPSDGTDRIMVVTGKSPTSVQTTSLALERKKVQDRDGPAVATAEAQWLDSTNRLNRLWNDTQIVENDQRLVSELKETQAATQAANAELVKTLDARERTLRWALPAACGLFLALTLAALVAGLWRGMRYYVTAAGSLGLAGAAALLFALHVGEIGESATQSASASTITFDVNGRAIAQMMGEMGFGGGGGAKDELELGRALGEAGRGAAGENWKVPAVRGAVLGGLAGQPPPRDAAPMAAPAGAPAAGAKPEAHGGPMGNVNKPVDVRTKTAAQKPNGLNNGVEDRKAGLDIPNQAKLQMAKERDRGKLLDGQKAMEKQLQDGDMLKRKDEADAFGDKRMPPFGNRRGAVRQLANQQEIASAPPPPFVVREYAHQHSAAPTGDRTDFAETVFWHPVLVLPKDGATVSFDLGDDVTRYQVLVAAHTLDGRLGAVESLIEARKPFSVEPKLPVEITAGDRIDVPVTLANDTDASRLVTINAQPKGLTLIGSAERRLTLTAQQRARQVFQFQPSIVEGKAELRFDGKCEPFGDDAVVRTIPVVPDGFPIVGSISGALDGVAKHEVVLPQTWVAGTLKCQVNVYPSTLAELQKGLDALLQEPGGCFEQTSTTNYPNTLVLEYLRESDQANPDAMKRAKGLLERGYAKLTSFEVPASGVASAPRVKEGFEWFGSTPAHEALTAYGLMQFRDMARVTDVDPQMIKRTRDFLLARRDGKGGFARNPQALDSFGRAPDDVTNAYIVWALTEGGKDDDITKELNKLAEQAKTSDDPYFLALVANTLLNRDRADEAVAILTKLAGKLTKDGCLDGAKTSITGSAGRTLQIETTALAVLGWLKANRPAEFTVPVRAAVTWIGKQRGGQGGFGSTQSTILALKALIAFTKANKKTPEAGELSLTIGGRVLSKIAFAAGEQNALTIDVLAPERQLKPGKNDVQVAITGKNVFPYTLAWSYQSLQPASAEGCAVRLTTALAKADLHEGDAAQLQVKVENVSGKGQGMAVAIIGLPAGLKLPDDFAQLKDLARLRENGTKPGQIGAFEVRGRELVLYWRDLAPDAKIDLTIDLRAHVPGVYHGPASRAYLYYNADVKHWATPLAATIAAKE